MEIKAYRVPKTMSTPHGYKYSLVYIYDGHRLVGYDNHERKGDHCTIGPSQYFMHSDPSIASSMTFSSMWQPSRRRLHDEGQTAQSRCTPA